MDRLTNQTQWTDDIDLKHELGYKYIFQRLAEYENTGLMPDEIFGELKSEKFADVISSDDDFYHFCSECNNEVYKKDKYCHTCGRELKWGIK